MQAPAAGLLLRLVAHGAREVHAQQSDRAAPAQAGAGPDRGLTGLLPAWRGLAGVDEERGAEAVQAAEPARGQGLLAFEAGGPEHAAADRLAEAQRPEDARCVAAHRVVAAGAKGQ